MKSQRTVTFVQRVASNPTGFFCQRLMRNLFCVKARKNVTWSLWINHVSFLSAAVLWCILGMLLTHSVVWMMDFLFNLQLFLSLITSALHTNGDLFFKITIFQFEILAALMYAKLYDVKLLLFYLFFWNTMTFDMKLLYKSNLYLMSYFAFWYSILSLGSKSFSFIFYHGCSIANSHNKSVFLYKSRFNYGLTELSFNRKPSE